MSRAACYLGAAAGDGGELRAEDGALVPRSNNTGQGENGSEAHFVRVSGLFFTYLFFLLRTNGGLRAGCGFRK
jgi:hypothetical protein